MRIWEHLKMSSLHLLVFDYFLTHKTTITSGSPNQHYPDYFILLLIFNYFPQKASNKLFNVKALSHRNLGASSISHFA